MRPKKLKRVPLKEELVALTDDFIKALILQQFLYWSERVSDFDDFILEEKERLPELKIDLRHGWIYKSADQLHDELMFGDNLSPRTVKRRIDEIVNAGYLISRNNPNHKWDRCLQYRPDIQKIQTDLQQIGYALEGYSLLIPSPPFDTVSNANDIETNRTVASDQAIPETTSETTSETTLESLKASSANADFSRPVSLLSEKEIRTLELTANDWKQYLNDEQADRGRIGIIKFIEGKIQYWNLLPHSDDEKLLFEILKAEYEDAGKSPPKKFPGRETKRLFNEAAGFHNGALESVIKKAIHKRGKGISKIVDYISSPKWQENTNEQTRNRGSKRQATGEAGARQRTSSSFAPPPGSGQSPETARRLRKAFAPKI